MKLSSLEIMKAVEIRIVGYFIYNSCSLLISLLFYVIFIFALTGSVENEVG